jgi:hypothetical protein
LVRGSNRRTHFWKRTIQWLFHQNLVLIEQMVSDKKIFMGMKPLGQLQPNFGGMVLGWPPLKFVSGDPNFQPRWPPS